MIKKGGQRCSPFFGLAAILFARSATILKHLPPLADYKYKHL